MLFDFCGLLCGAANWLNHSTCSDIHQGRKLETPKESLKALRDKHREKEPLSESMWVMEVLLRTSISNEKTQ